MTKTIRVVACGLLVWGCFLTGRPSWAEPLQYALELPAGHPVNYTLEVRPTEAGLLEIAAEWSGLRVLSFRVDPPGGVGATARRSGPSPQVLQVEVPPLAAAMQQPWRLQIRGLSNRDGGSGVLSIHLPQPAAPEPVIEEPLPPAVAAVAAAPALPAGAPSSWARFWHSLDGFAEELAASELPDSCRWQDSLVDYLQASRVALVNEGSIPETKTREALRQLIESIRLVDAVRTSEDPLLAGPVPDRPAERRQWNQQRDREMRQVEDDLDATLLSFQRGHAPDLEEEAWPVRLVSCVAACERHFDQRVLVGEERAANFDLANAQWERLIRAAAVLETYIDLEASQAP